MAVLEHLEPKSVFRFFEELCAIPHGSSNTKQISDWLVAFAGERDLEAWQDELNNVIIVKEATPGYEAAPGVILQGHVDMVCEKAPDCPKDMEQEGLDLAVEGDTVYAIGTTLGGDDGIAVAMALAILDAKDLRHPRVEAVFTVDEEIGMLGAAERVICFLTCLPNGVQTMSADIPGLVQTSLNLGVLRATETELYSESCVRSSVDSQKQMLVERICCLTEQLGGTVEVHGDYAGWAYQQESPLRELLVEVFTEQYGHPPKIEAIHAGLECGVFISKLPGLDCVSLGPDLTEIHTCREKLHIASTRRLWALVTETLKRMK